MSEQMMAACGLDCGKCEIRLVLTDPGAAKVAMDWYRSRGWLSEGEGMAEVMKRKMYCTGCHGNRETHWSADCWILQCCVDQHGHSNCSQCESFPCSGLVDWAKGDESYGAALARLKAIRAAIG